MEIPIGQGKFIFTDKEAERIKNMSDCELNHYCDRLAEFVRRMEPILELPKEEEPTL